MTSYVIITWDVQFKQIRPDKIIQIIHSIWMSLLIRFPSGSGWVAWSRKKGAMGPIESRTHGPEAHNRCHPTESFVPAHPYPRTLPTLKGSKLMESMASCRINFKLRCPPDAPSLASTSHAQNPRAPLLFFNSIPSSSAPYCKAVTYPRFHFLCTSIRYSKTLLITWKTCASDCSRSCIPVLGAVTLLLWGLTRLPRRNPAQRTQCWSVHP